MALSPRHLLSLGLLLSSSALLSTACGGDGRGTPDKLPQREDWQSVQVPFPHEDGAGAAQITSLNIGGLEIGGSDSTNFANRGDVWVEFSDQLTDEIRIESRKFTFAADADEAQATFDNMEIIAVVGTPSPGLINGVPEEIDCMIAFQEGCSIRLMFKGQAQPARTGADLRVTLPSSYNGAVNITTNDNLAEGKYLDRGNVCVLGANQSRVNVSLAQGNAFVAMSSDLTPGPQCSASRIEACENFEKDGEPAPWDPTCGCDTFGTVTVAGDASDIVIDVPKTVWTNVTANNEQPGQTRSGDHCTAEITIPGVDLKDADNPWQATGEANDPGDSAPEGAGFAVNAKSDKCTSVLYTENPDEFVGVDGDKNAQSEDASRGNIRVCSDCLAFATSCEDLIPDREPEGGDEAGPAPGDDDGDADADADAGGSSSSSSSGGDTDTDTDM